MQKGSVNTLKERLDVLLVQKGFFDSREKARELLGYIVNTEDIKTNNN